MNIFTKLNSSRNGLYILTIILIGAFIVRLHGFTNPIADWHSWRQADTSAVSRNFIKKGFDILHPRFDDLSNVPSGIDNPQGYRFVEFPIYNIFQAGLFTILPFLTLEEWGRIVTIISSELTILFLYLLVKRYTNIPIALLTAFAYAFIPYDIYYGRTILPDPSMSMTTLGAIYFFAKAIDPMISGQNKNIKFTNIHYINLCIALIFSAVALLLKPFAIFFFLPMVYIAWKRFGIKFIMRWQLWLFAILAVLPLGLWRVWISHYPEGIPASDWLFNGGGIRFRPAFFRWILYERLTKLFLGFAGLFPLFLGIWANWKNMRKHMFKNESAFLFWSFALSSVIYVCVVARGNVQHDYYQIPIMPSIALFVGLGSYYFLTTKIATIYIRTIVLAFVYIVSFYFSWQTIGHYFDIDNHSIIAAGKAVDALTPPNAKIIAPYDGDTSFLYQTNRQGWAEFEKSTEQMIALGADYLVLENPTQQDRNSWPKQYQLIKSTPQYILINLRKKV